MSTPDQHCAAVSDALREACAAAWPARVEYLDFDDARATFRLERDGASLVVHVSATLTRGGEAIRHEESHRFPGDTDLGQVAANVLRRLEEVHDAIQGVDVPEGGVGQVVRSHRLASLSRRAYLDGDATALGDFLAIGAAASAETKGGAE
jgi:hypothetical protein